MNLQTILNQKNMTMYQLSKISGIPKTTVIDIFSGKSSIEKCSAKTVYQLAKALDCTMEDIMQLDRWGQYDENSRFPDKSESFITDSLVGVLKGDYDNKKEIIE